MDDFFETVPYNHSEFPIYIQKETFYALQSFVSHTNWHNDIEFVKILSGNINYNINGEIFKLSKGCGLFINSNQIHYSFSVGDSDCDFICIVFQPTFLCAKKYYEEKYILPILTNSSLPYYVFNEDTPWEKEVIECIQTIFDAEFEECFELELHQAFFSMWASIYKNLCFNKKSSAINKQNVEAFKKMIAYIQFYYKEKITLQELATAGSVCKTGCNKIFKTFTGRTPIEYITDHRLRKAIEMIENRDMSLTEICYECGFAGASYFSETFKKVFGISPGKFKRTSNYDREFFKAYRR